MNKRVKAKWLAALRSGKYKQGRGSLRVGGRFCCLGVLCDLHAKRTKRRWRGGTYLSNAYTLSKTVQRWAGLESEACDLAKPHGKSEHLAACNDAGMSFEEIATIIEKEF